MLSRGDSLFLNRSKHAFCGVLAAALGGILLGGCVTMDEGGGDSPVTPIRGVLIDPGHGGDPRNGGAGREECYGAISAQGYMEKTATLEVARKLKSLLEKQGLATEMTRSSDTYVSLEERVSKAMALPSRDWLFVSIHFNRSSGKQQATKLSSRYRAPRGFEIYMMPRAGERSSQGSRASKNYVTVNNTRSGNFLLSQCVENRLHALPGMVDRGIKEAWFVVLRGSPVPAVLIEGGFLSNPEEGQRIASEGYQWLLARAIAAAVSDYQSRTSTYARADRISPPARYGALSSREATAN